MDEPGPPSDRSLEPTEVWRDCRDERAASPSLRIPDRFRQHGVKLALGELRGLLRYFLPRHDPCNRARAGGQRRRCTLRHRHYPGLCRRRLVTALQVKTSELGTDCVAAIAETTRDLGGTLSCCPELLEQCYVFRIPTHDEDYTPNADCALVVTNIAWRMAEIAIGDLTCRADIGVAAQSDLVDRFIDARDRH